MATSGLSCFGVVVWGVLVTQHGYGDRPPIRCLRSCGGPLKCPAHTRLEYYVIN